MTIEEAIKHAEEVADEKKKEACNLYDVKNYEESRECIWCSEEHRQLAEWLKDYKRLLDQQPCDDAISRKAVLDLVNADWKYEGLETDVASLPPVTPQPCDDAISRETLLTNLYQYKISCAGRIQAAILEVEELVEKMPPVTPQQKYGKWILADEQNKEDVENDNYRFICSECQCSDIHAKGAIVPYCWKCGAKMQESKETGEIHCNHTDTEIAKSFIEDVEAVKELLPKAGK